MYTQSSKLRKWSLYVATLATAAFLLQGCGGGDDGAAGPAGPAGAAGATGATGPTGPSATAKLDVASMTSDEWADLTLMGEVTKVTISSAPVVEFKVTDAKGTPIVGLAGETKTSSTALASHPNFNFALAKLVPGTDGSPSKWVSYMVTGTAATPAAGKPSYESTGTLVDNGDGSYKYTFYRDITRVKEIVDGLTFTAPNVKADLGDLTYVPTLTHRVVVQITGNFRGTGSNTADGVTTVPAVGVGHATNLIYDFIPATGKAVTSADLQRNVVSKDNCNECHNEIGVTTPHGGRVDTRMCVVCHTDQRKYSVPDEEKVASTNGAFPTLSEKAYVDPETGITTYYYSKHRTGTASTAASYHPTGKSTTISDGDVNANFPVFIHRIHNGNALVKKNYNYANVVFNNKGYSMLGGGQKMCTKCHDNTKAAQADNWNAVPSRLACGSCHDGINFATGGGSTLADRAAAGAVGAVLATSGHAGKTQSTDKACALCHAPADIKVYHQTDNVTTHNPTIATGLKTIAYEIKSATVNATTNDVTIEFKISVDGAAAILKTPAAGLATSLDGFTDGPTFILAYAMPQDGITSPVDYNNAGVKQGLPPEVTLASLMNTTNTVGSISGPVSGYYKATLKGDGTTDCGGTTATGGTPVKCVFPVGAKLRAVAMNGYYTQISPAAVRHAISVVKAVTGDAVRRTVVDPAKCSNCHEWIEFHGGNRVYQTQVCVMCHVPALASSGRGISDTKLAGYVFNAAKTKILADWAFNKAVPNPALNFPVTTNNFKDMIHGIHAGRDRVTPFKDARDGSRTSITLLDFRRMDFPGKLKACETCHVTATTTTSTFNTVPANTLASTYESIDAAYDTAITAGSATAALAQTALKTANGTDKVTTPFAAACVSCHDSSAAQAHITLNGGQIQVKRSALALTGESCKVCHGAGAEFDTVKAHQ